MACSCAVLKKLLALDLCSVTLRDTAWAPVAMGLQLPDEYGYVVLAHCLSWISNFYLTFNVASVSVSIIVSMGQGWKIGFCKRINDTCIPSPAESYEVRARKQYNVQYPALYAPDNHSNAEKFNSVQQLGMEPVSQIWCTFMFSSNVDRQNPQVQVRCFTQPGLFVWYS